MRRNGRQDRNRSADIPNSERAIACRVWSASDQTKTICAAKGLRLVGWIWFHATCCRADPHGI